LTTGSQKPIRREAAMAQTDETSEAPEVVEALKELPADHPLVKAYQAEKTKRKDERNARTALETEVAEERKLNELKTAHPFLDKADFKGLTLEEWDARATRLSELRGNGTAATETPAEPKPEEAALAAAAALKGTPGDATKTYTGPELYEKLQKGEITDAQMNEIIAAGRMKT
jgi:hypothetical protein